jgi:uncharacterized membrane protein
LGEGALAGYLKRLEADVARWVAAGMIGPETAQALLADVRANDRSSISFGFILMMMAALLLSAGLLLVVASNWEAIPRLTRVGVIAAAIFAGYIGGAFLKGRESDAAAQAAWLLAATAFGAGIALVGQMYHLSGDEGTALIVWCAGTALAAAALRSGPLTVGAVAIACLWMVSRGFDLWSAADFPYAYPVAALGIWLVSLWTGSVAARHLIVLSMIAYTVMFSVTQEAVQAAAALALVCGGMFVWAVAAPDVSERVVRLDDRLPLHCLIGFLAGAVILQLQFIDDAASFGLIALAAVAATIAALLFAGRSSRGLRWLAYLGFALELALLYVVLIGTMLDTAALLVAAAVTLGALAFVILRIERRMKPRGAV